MPPQHRFAPHPPPRRERGREDEIHVVRRGSGGASQIVRPSDLSQYFGLAEHLRVQSGGHGEDVLHRAESFPTLEHDLVRDPADTGELAERRLVVAVTIPVELAAIAGGEEQCGAAAFACPFQPRRHLGGREAELLPQLDAGCMVAYANDMEGRIDGHPQRVH